MGTNWPLLLKVFALVLVVFVLLAYSGNQVLIYRSPPSSVLLASQSDNATLSGHENDNADDLWCHLLPLDAWMNSSAAIFKADAETSVRCSQTQANLTTYENGILSLLNSSATCQYRTFEISRRSLTYTAWKALLPAKNLSIFSNFIDVTCSSENGTVVYRNVHAGFGVPKRSNLGVPSERRLNIGLIVLDSVSLPIVKKYLPKFHAYLRGTLDAYTLEMYTKVGDNSFPNEFPMLTGYRYEASQADMPAEFTRRFGTQNNAWPLVYDEFQREGYLTYVDVDDRPIWYLDGWQSVGLHQNADFGWVAFFKHFYANNFDDTSSAFCLKNTPRHVMQLEHLAEFTERFANTSLFYYFHMGDLPHDDDSSLAKADEDLERFARRLTASGHLNRTVLFVTADHGPRFTSRSANFFGYIEERMPVQMVVLPRWFEKVYPEFVKNLGINRKRLASHFDLHRTLQHLKPPYFPQIDRKNDQSARGRSLFDQIPVNRTCREAGIPDTYCVCNLMTPTNVSSTVVGEAASAILAQIRAYLEDKPCRRLELNRIHDAARLTRAPLRRGDVSTTAMLSVVVETVPGNALFRAQVQCNASRSCVVVGNDISRINRYGNQSWCIDSQELVVKKLCFCN